MDLPGEARAEPSERLVQNMQLDPPLHLCAREREKERERER